MGRLGRGFRWGSGSLQEDVGIKGFSMSRALGLRVRSLST